MSQSGPGVALRADIQRSGYYPEIVGEALDTALGSEVSSATSFTTRRPLIVMSCGGM